MAICHFPKPETNKGDFRLYFELVEKVVGGATTQKYQKQTQTPWYLHYGRAPRGAKGVKNPGRTKGSMMYFYANI